MSFVFTSIDKKKVSKKKEVSSTYGAINTGNTAIFVVDFYVNDNTSRIRVIISRNQVEEVGTKALTQSGSRLLTVCFMVAVSRCRHGEHEVPVCEISINTQYQCKCP